MGEFANRPWVKVLAWSTAAVILALNFWLLGDQTDPVAQGRSVAHWWWSTPLLAGIVVLLGWITFSKGRTRPRPETSAAAVAADLARAGLSQDSGAARSQLARPRGHRARR